MIEIDAAIVRCPVGHGLFVISGGPASRSCPGCGAYLVAVHDDAPLGGSGVLPGGVSPVRATDPPSSTRDVPPLSPDEAALIFSA